MSKLIQFMPLTQQCFLDFLEFRAHAIASGFPPEEEPAPARFPADEREAQEIESLRFAEPPPFAINGRVTAEFDQAGLVRMQR